MDHLLTTALQILEFTGGLTLLIVLHEAGHYFAARKFGVTAEEIGLGLPPRICNIGKFQGAPVSLNWLPLGAFVKLRGETDDNVPGGLNQIHPFKRILVFLAGPIVNLITALILFTAVNFGLGVKDGSRLTIMTVLPEAPAGQAGLQQGDIIYAINGKPFASYEEFKANIDANLDQRIVINYLRHGQEMHVTAMPRSKPPEGQGALGISIRQNKRAATIPEGIANGWASMGRYIEMLMATLGGLVTGASGAINQLVGFKGMFDVYAYTQEPANTEIIPGWISALEFFAMISASLGTLNLFPIPALDGGRVLFTLPEWIFKCKIPRKVENAIMWASFVLLIALVLYVNIRDIISPIPLPNS